MKGLVYHGPGHCAWQDVPDRRIQEPTDAIVRIDTSTICGTDLHILKGDVPTCSPGPSSATRPSGRSSRSARR